MVKRIKEFQTRRCGTGKKGWYEREKFVINSQKEAKIREFSVSFRVISAKFPFGPKIFLENPKIFWIVD